MSKILNDRPPDQLDGADVICFASVDGLSKTDVCAHSVDGQVQCHFSYLVIASYKGDSGFYLFYCDSEWKVENDTLHYSIDEAKEFTDQQYPGVFDRWVDFRATA